MESAVDSGNVYWTNAYVDGTVMQVATTGGTRRGYAMSCTPQTNRLSETPCFGIRPQFYVLNLAAVQSVQLFRDTHARLRGVEQAANVADPAIACIELTDRADEIVLKKLHDGGMLHRDVRDSADSGKGTDCEQRDPRSVRD